MKLGLRGSVNKVCKHPTFWPLISY